MSDAKDGCRYCESEGHSRCRIESRRARLSGQWRTLAKDGRYRAEVREACTGPLVDYSGASWREWAALEAVAQVCAELTANHRGQTTTQTGSNDGD